MKLTATVTDLPEKTNRQWSETRNFGGGRSRTYQLPRKETPMGKSRAYVHIDGEGIWENIANRTTRPHTEWKPLVLQALREAGVNVVSLRWSLKAGCSCPCSPAFFITGDNGRDIWVTITADVPQTVDPELAQDRLAQVAAQL